MLKHVQDGIVVCCCCCSVVEWCPILCNPMDCCMPGLPVHHQLLEFTQTQVHWVGDANSSSVVPFSSCLQPFPASGAFLVSQLFTSGGQSIGASVSCMLSSQLGRNMFCIMFEWEPSVWEEIELYLQWTATLENRAVLCNWTCLSLVVI